MHKKEENAGDDLPSIFEPKLWFVFATWNNARLRKPKEKRPGWRVLNQNERSEWGHQQTKRGEATGVWRKPKNPWKDKTKQT